MKTKLYLSLISLVGAILLFVFTSLAWFAVSDIIDIGIFSAQVNKKNIDFELYESEDGITYSLITELSFNIAIPGDSKYYRLVITNPEVDDFEVFVVLDGVDKVMSNGAVYSGPASVFSVINVETVIDSATVIDNTIDTLIDGQTINITDFFVISGGESKTVDFTFSLLSSAGNEFQGLGLEIDDVIIYFNG